MSSASTADIAQIRNKIKLLFEKIVEPNYVMNAYYSDSLIIKLSNCSDSEISFLSSVPLISDLIPVAILQAQQSHLTVKVFLTRLLAIVSQKELQFAKMFSIIGEVVNKDLKEINSPTMNASLRVAYMEVANALLNHDSGIAWLLRTGVWRNILNLATDKYTVFVLRQSYKFVTKFIWRLNDLNEETNVKAVLDHILKPIIEVDILKHQSLTSQEEDKIALIIEPMLQMLLAIVNEGDQIQNPNIVSKILAQNMVTRQLYPFFDRIRKENIVLLIIKLLFSLILAKQFLVKPASLASSYTSDDLMELSAMYFNAIQELVRRRASTLLLDFCYSCILLWLKIWKDKKLENDGKIVQLQNKLLFICLVPGLVYVKKSEVILPELIADRINEYVVKLLSLSCEHTSRAGYAIRDLVLELGPMSITLQSVKRLTCLLNNINNEQANIIFQSLFYILKDYEPTEDDLAPTDTYEDCQDKVSVMTYVLQMVLNLVKNYDINWHATLEVICLFKVVYNILKRPNLSCKFVVTGLNIIAVTVKKFLPPNLSLLMDSEPGSEVRQLGALIFLKLHDIHWEVRDSALELLHVMTDIAFVKFPPFQKQILEHNLCNVAATVALNDFEYYVQVTGLRCVGAASKIAALWDRLKEEHADIQERLILILRNDQEGVVRKEACSVLCQLYQNLKLTPAFKNIIYDHMVSSALSDFHWEVQLTALKFWKVVICTSLSDLGMLDGTFPPVTFSRQSRKIITLNEAAIQRLLQKNLEELSAIGCLTVLVKLLHEDTELEILEATLGYAQELLQILDMYKVHDVLLPKDTDPRSVDEVLIKTVENDVSDNVDQEMNEPESTLKADNIIDGIINSQDVNLLASIYERHMNLQVSNKDTMKPKISVVRNVSPYLFVIYLKSKDFKAIIEYKRKWRDGIRSFSSLLDDALGIYEINNDEINSLDCY